MGKVIGIDFGAKRTGIAISDEMQLIASGLTTVSTDDLIQFLQKLVIEENITCFVVGYPKNLDGSNTDITNSVNYFISQSKKIFPKIKSCKIDERFTSKIAKQTIIASGVSKKVRRDKKLIDKVSATIILQNFLDYQS